MLLSQAGTWLLAGPLVGAALSAQRAAGASEPVARIAMVTDVHYANRDTRGTRHYRDSLQKLDEALALWKRDRVDAGVELGDLVDASPTVELETADLRRVLRTLRQLDVPWHFVLGNHCVTTLSKAQFLAEWNAPSPYYAFTVKGRRCLVLDGTFSSDGRPYGGREFDWKDAYLPPDQLEWLRKELAAAAGPVLVFVHHRLDTADYYSVKNAAEVRAVLEQSGKVAAVFQGHQHVNAHKMIGGIHYCTLPAMVDGPPPDNSAYGVLEIYPEGHMHLRGYRLMATTQLG